MITLEPNLYFYTHRVYKNEQGRISQKAGNRAKNIKKLPAPDKKLR